MSNKTAQLIEILRESNDWISAQSLAERLHVTSRSVRNYIAAAKASAEPFEIISASARGYKLNTEAFATFREAQATNPTASPTTPRERAHHIIRLIIDAKNGITLEEIAKLMHVSLATAELDLKRARDVVEPCEVLISRSEGYLYLEGTETAIRRVISLLVYSSLDTDFVNLYSVATRFEIPKLVEFKTDLIERLDFHGFIINEYGIDSVLLHVAITVDRVRNGRTLPDEPQDLGDEASLIASVIQALVARHFDVSLGQVEEAYLARQVATRVISAAKKSVSAAAQAAPEDRETLLRVLDKVYEEYLVDLRNEELVERLALHLGHLFYRAKFNVFSRNPIAKSIKTSYPLIFDLAVYMCSLIQKERGITIDEDEISYVALHIGSFLERQAQEENRVTATIICPSYYDLHIVMRESIEKDLGEEISIESVVNRTDVDVRGITSDIIISTIPMGLPLHNALEVKPFLTQQNMTDLRNLVAGVRASRRRSKIRERLIACFREDLFFRNISFDDPEHMIRILGKGLTDLEIVEQDYVEGAIERERMSSTVFVDGLAVPHDMTMSAKVPTIAIAVNEEPGAWGEQTVNVVAFIAFAASGREEFQPVLEQFVDVFSDRSRMQEIIRGSRDFDGFIASLTKAMAR
ncbi:BglG family transcription antiterminator [Rhodoluna limnophila]|uniref:BglG family transcription antiterminator n=1 Tax=Rhodoluna limnophila TaxID=232537 RepID=UPI001106887B|nr:BglG family transcription antiterminator [Rhodoluna limnophila]